MRAKLPFDVAIEKPCEESWAAMAGGARERHCELCDKKVHDFASMTSRDIAKLVVQSEGKVCARVTRREDGSLVTLDAASSVGGGRLAAQMAVSASLLLGASSGMAQAGVEKPVAAPVCALKATDVDSTAAGEQASVRLREDQSALMGEVTVTSADVLPTAQAQINSVMDEKVPEGQGEAVLTGIVLKAVGKVPAEGAFVRLVQAGAIKATAKTDEQGRFRLVALPGRYDIVVKELPLVSVRVVAADLHAGEQVLPAIKGHFGEVVTDSGTDVFMGAIAIDYRYGFKTAVRNPIAFLRHLLGRR